MANTINWGKIYESTYWGNTDNNISWGKAYADLAGVVPALVSEFVSRVEADGGSVESTECMSTDLTFLVNNPEPVDFTGLLNDYSGAAAAYSLRLLDNTYSGNAIKVRRSSDNAEQDIAFVNNELDTTSLETFAGSGDAFVTTWYDQSGNDRNVTKSTASSQPQIVSSGSTITHNGKPAIEFGASNAIKLQHTEDQLLSSNNSLFASVYKPSILSNYNIFDSKENDKFLLQSYSGQYNFSNGTDIFLSKIPEQNQILALLDFNGSTLKSYFDGSNTSTHTGLSSTKRDGLTIGGHRTNDGTNGFIGKYQELVYWDSNNSDNVSGIQTNINDFYDIY
jgi:hypothetical protein